MSSSVSLLHRGGNTGNMVAGDTCCVTLGCCQKDCGNALSLIGNGSADRQKDCASRTCRIESVTAREYTTRAAVTVRVFHDDVTKITPLEGPFLFHSKVLLFSCCCCCCCCCCCYYHYYY